MLQLRRSNERGLGEHGWLTSRHTFSFAHYSDPRHMGFRSLRVINEDRIAGHTGFGAHPHRDMEIISYVLSGKLEHQDSMGNKAVITPGEVQRMSAGSGVVHSEKNPIADESHFFQIWIQPKVQGGTPGYGQKTFKPELESKKKTLVLSEEGRDGSIDIKQDVDLYVSRLKVDDVLPIDVRKGRGVWIQVVGGTIDLKSLASSEELKGVSTGDGVAIEDTDRFEIRALAASELLIFDLA